MPKYKIGVINKDSMMAEWQKEASASAPNILVTVAVLLIILGTIYLLASNWFLVLLYLLNFSTKILTYRMQKVDWLLNETQ